MHNNTPEPTDNEIMIVDLDPIEQKGHNLRKKILSGQRLGLWVRCGLALLMLGGGFILLYLIWPDASSVMGQIRGQQPFPPLSPTPLGDTNQNIGFNLLPANGTIYISTLKYTPSGTPHGTLDALREKDSTHLWRYPGTLIAHPQLNNNILYIPSSTGLEALRANNRTLLWHNPVAALSWQLAHGILYIHSLSDGLLALHADTGKLLWQRKDITDSIPTLSNDIIYTRSQQASSLSLTALRSRDGTTLWSYQLPLQISILFTIQVGNGTLCIIGPGDLNNIVVLRSSDGTLLWQKTLQVIGQPNNDFLYTISNTDNSLHALRITDGTSLWQRPFSQDAFFLIQNEVIYFLVPDQNVGALRASDGTLLWQHKAGFGTMEFVQNGVLCIHSSDSNGGTSLLGLRISDGTQLWQHQLPGGLDGRALPSNQQDGIIYFFAVSTDVSGFIEALQNNTGSLLWHYTTDEQNRGAYIGLTQHGVTYIAITNNATILALHSSNGSLLWSYQPKVGVK